MAYCITPPEIVSIPVAGNEHPFPVRRVYCVGRNYAAHAREMGFDPDREPPFFFCKPADAVRVALPGNTLTISYPPQTSDLHYEVELVVAIGRSGFEISPEEAKEYIWGYAVGLDMTRRDLQKQMREMGRPWEIGKAFDDSAPIGPLHRADQVSGINSARITLDVDGVRKQDSTTDKLIWSVPETISHLSHFFRLEPGDIIYTGTPEGVGPVNRGQIMEAAVQGLDTISVKVV